MNGHAGRSSALAALVVFDGTRGPSATQMISFGRPFEGVEGRARMRVVFESSDSESSRIEEIFATVGPDVLILSRCTSDRGSDWIRSARTRNLPVIFHIDDDLLAVPASVGEAKAKAYNRPERLKALRENIEASDLVYVSTIGLAERFGEHSINVPIVAGDIYCSVSANEVGAILPSASGPVIGYMGTSGHSADLAMVLPAICEVMEAVPDLQFEVFGTIKMPPELQRFGRRVRHITAFADYSEFVTSLRSLGWWVGLAPLEDNPFNRCKADTKWVEYGSAGMAVIASDLPVYHRACAGGAGFLATTTAEWTNYMLDLLHRPDLRDDMIRKAETTLRERYTHECLREQVMQVIDQAFATSRVEFA